MERYLGQVHRSKSKVKVRKSKNVQWCVPLTSESYCLWTCQRRNYWEEYEDYGIEERNDPGSRVTRD